VCEGTKKIGKIKAAAYGFTDLRIYKFTDLAGAAANF
jgi:hypothetical protein